MEKKLFMYVIANHAGQWLPREQRNRKLRIAERILPFLQFPILS